MGFGVRFWSASTGRRLDHTQTGGARLEGDLLLRAPILRSQPRHDRGVLPLLDPLTDLKASIAREPDRGTGRFCPGFNHLAYAALAAAHVDLLQQHVLLVNLAH